jgi:uncharacterized membrane protein
MSISLGLRQLNSEILVNASAENCYKTWVDTKQIPVFMRRVRGLNIEFLTNLTTRKLAIASTSADAIQARIKRFQQSDSTATELRRWIFRGPGGKLYEIENTVIVEIPNYFYCTASTDPDDVYSESCVFFIEDERNQTTLVKWEITFWQFSSQGSWTQFALDLQDAKDSFMHDCLEDFKQFVEGRSPEVANNHGNRKIK